MLTWAEKGFVVTQETDYPRQQGSRLTINGHGPLEIKLRVPSWAESYEVKLNGKVLHGPPARPGSYLSINRPWKPGDTIEVSIPFPVRIEKALDRPEIQSVFHGPVLLPALSAETTFRTFSFYKDLKLDGDLSRAVVAGAAGQFTTNGHTLRPLYVGDNLQHHPYFQRSEPSVVFGTHDSGVPNRDQGDGSTFLDQVWADAPFRDQHKFEDAVRKVARDASRRGLLTKEEEKSVLDAAHAAEPDLRV